jgi:hypothetical protein
MTLADTEIKVRFSQWRACSQDNSKSGFTVIYLT